MTVDFLDRSELVVPPIAPRRRVTQLFVDSDVPQAQVFVDGVSVGATPVEALALCPARRTIEVRRAERVTWSQTMDLADGPVRITAVRRPSLRAIFAQEDGPGAEPSPAGSLFRERAAPLRERVASLRTFSHVVPAGAASDRELLQSLHDRTTRTSPPGFGADLLLVVSPDASSQNASSAAAARLRLLAAGSNREVSVVCPLDDAGCLDRFFTGLEQPWPRGSPITGLSLAPDPRGGLLVLASRGPARRAGIHAGDRIVNAGGVSASTPDAIRVAAERVLRENGAPRFSEIAEDLTLVIERSARRTEARMAVRSAPEVARPAGGSVPAPRVVASAALDVSVLPPGEERNAALLNLASMAIEDGSCEQALIALEASGWAEEVEGAASAGTARFLQGLCLLRIGHTGRAAEAFERAARDEGATLWIPDGLPVAPLAKLALSGVRNLQAP